MAVAATRRARIATGVLMVVLVVVASGTGVPSDIRDGVAGGSDVAVRALVGALVGGTLGVALLLGARRIGVTTRLRLAGTAASLAILTIAALVATAAVAMAPLHPARRNVDPVASVGPAPTRPGGTSSGRDPGAVGLPGWLEGALVVIGIVVTALLVLGAVRTLSVPKRLRRGLLGPRNRRDAEAVHEDVDVEAAAEVFERAASLGDGSDPRAAIIAAYARLLDGLGDVGCARKLHEAPEEHLRRSLVTLGVEAEHMRLVVDTFLVARFSSHPLTNADADGVRSALLEVGAQLRSRVVGSETAMVHQ